MRYWEIHKEFKGKRRTMTFRKESQLAFIQSTMKVEIRKRCHLSLRLNILMHKILIGNDEVELINKISIQ